MENIDRRGVFLPGRCTCCTVDRLFRWYLRYADLTRDTVVDGRGVRVFLFLFLLVEVLIFSLEIRRS